MAPLRHLKFSAALFALLGAAAPRLYGQTPSPLQEWQYSAGIMLEKLFEPQLPDIRVVVGLGAEFEPAYEGARADRVRAGPVINIQYENGAFLTSGDGIGCNIVQGEHFDLGISLVYDLGRTMKADLANLHGLGDIGTAPVAKVFGQWVLSKAIPLVVRADARQFIGGAQGALGDVGLYIPLPGSSRQLQMFLGPSISFATRHYLQVVYGVTPAAALASDHPVYAASGGGTAAVGLGFSASRFITDHWLVNLDAAVDQLKGSAADSPLVERRTQKALAVSVDYKW